MNIEDAENFAGIKLSPEQRIQLERALEGCADDRTEEAVAYTLVAVGFYRRDEKRGTNTPMSEARDEIKASASHGSDLLRVLGSLSANAQSELESSDAAQFQDWGELFEQAPTPREWQALAGESGGFLSGGLAPRLKQGSLDRLRGMLSEFVVVAESSASRVHVPRGRSKDPTIKALAYRAALIWRRYTDGQMRRDAADYGHWPHYLRSVYQIAGVDRDGRKDARELADYFGVVDQTPPQ